MTSHAGRFETHIVSEPGELDAAVDRVHESATKLGVEPHEFGVVVQEFVEPEVAGVVMSTDPLSGIPSAFVEFVRGRGERLVSGLTNPWSHRRGDAPPAASPLSATVLDQICAAAESTAALVGSAVDMEWAYADGVVHWLQLRPITGLKPRRPFVVPPAQAASLQGTWALMEHCFLPVAPLIVELDPGGYFDGPNWKSAVVAGYHYIAQNKGSGGDPSSSDARDMVARWSEIDTTFRPKLDEMLAEPLDGSSGAELWEKLNERADCNRRLFREYLDTRFFRIRRDSVAELRRLVEASVGSSGSAEAEVVLLLAGLDTLTAQKQQLVRELADLLRRHPGLAELGQRAASDAKAVLDWDSRWARLMSEFGFEAPNTELFYLPTLRETPELLLQSIRALAKSPARTAAAPLWRETAARIRASIGAEQVGAFDQQLLLARDCVRRTEDDDYLLQKASAAVRYALMEAGRRAADAGALSTPSEVFFLSLAELRAGLLSTAWPETRIDVERRQADFEAAKEMVPPPLIVDGQPRSSASTVPSHALKGQVASWGRSTGRAFVLTHPLHPPAMMPPGSVIVTTMLTPAVAYTLAGCNAIVTEVGGLASHGAIVARELGIPALVGVSDATRLVKSGAQITVDAFSGQVLFDAEQ